MAARARVEFITMGGGAKADGRAANVIDRLLSAVATLAVSSTATAGGSRPTAPEGERGKAVHARVTALDSPIYVAWGSDPTATATNSILLQAGNVEAIFLRAGEKLSFLEVT